ncbi:MAG: 2-C-methyl-D-erythritol 2,4-cyclodiphosphate synthase [Bacteroidetes bacterium]|jgi:2-C-methyl-D-erythritol 2,4-cyclodiphosphate synthase|nr:2-C-methyl-D-erythritol 2,4-cyclodiphosphate synthase [Bacteroidota bacterium]
MKPNFRVGLGYDVHAFSPGRKLILGGVEIPHSQGLKGHSDADVLLHAITDALLGAASLGDIGTHFPDTDPAFENADSIELLKKSAALVRSSDYEIANVDSTIVAETPQMAPHIPEMKKNIAAAIGCAIDDVSVKATTNEKMGWLGREEGIAVHCIALIGKL